MVLYGWRGKLLRVDLSERAVSTEEIDQRLLSAFYGGRGLNMFFLYQHLEAETSPFDPENTLIFGSGPFVGTSVPANGRYNVSSRSPLTGILGDANSAGIWAPSLRWAGYDGILVKGEADTPVYLSITEEGSELLDAAEIWGKTVTETDLILRQRHGKDAHILAIGPAGENRVRYASIMNDLDRAAGRTGNGAVMGAKRLKAIVIRARGKIPVADPDGLKEVCKKIRKAMLSSPSYPIRSQFGTPMLTMLYNEMGVLPTFNNQAAIFSEAEKISGERLKEEFVIRQASCYRCPVHCSRISRIDKGEFKGLEFEGPEFESICSLGSRLGHSNFEAILYLCKRLNDLGMDTISTGGTIAYAMECWQRGLLTEKDTEGLNLTWGNTGSIIQLVEKIAFRRGFGDMLAEGVQRASEKIPGSERYALHVKGMEIPTQEVRGLKAWGLGWAVSSRGADHCRAFPVMETTWHKDQAKEFFGTEKAADRFAYEGKAEMIKWAEDFGAVIDALGLCTISYVAMGLSPKLVAEAYRAVTGEDTDEEKLLETGDRIVTLERLLNLKLGLIPQQDTLPRRFIEEPVPEGPSAGEVIDIDKLVSQYYGVRDWDKLTGRPSKEKLATLGLSSLLAL